MKRAWSLSLALTPLVLVGCSHGGYPVSTPPQSVEAAVAHSVSAQMPELIQATGTVHAKETAMISSQVSGRIR
jgi:uncharacterized protein YcfL